MATKRLFVIPVNKSSALSASAAIVAMAVTLLVCSSLRAQQPDPNPIPTPSQPAPTSPSAPSAPVPSSGSSAASSHLMRTWRRLTYACDTDAKVVVNVHAKQARLVFKGKTYNLQQMDESDGQKYSGASLTWRLKEDVGTLERSTKSGEKSADSKPLASGCHLQIAGTNPASPPAKTPPAGH
jgi:membrane-bound inhibitor of C-type lysozyme